MNNIYIFFENTSNVDWLAILAFVVAALSLIFGIFFNRRTLKLTREHNLKSTEPLITDYYQYLGADDKGIKESIFYDVSNCGLGPAIITSLHFVKDGKNIGDASEIFKKHLEPTGLDAWKSNTYSLINSHILAPNEKLNLFEFYFDIRDNARAFHEWTKSLGFALEYETIYGEKRSFTKEKVCN